MIVSVDQLDSLLPSKVGTEFYSLCDLVELQKGSLVKQLQDFHGSFSSHIKTCLVWCMHWAYCGGFNPFLLLYCRYARGRVTTAYIAKLMSSCFHLTAMWRAVRTATQSPTGNILFGPTPSSLSFCCCSLQSTGNVCPNQRSVQIASESNKSSALSSICVNIAFVCVCVTVCVCVCMH